MKDRVLKQTKALIKGTPLEAKARGIYLRALRHYRKKRSSKKHKAISEQRKTLIKNLQKINPVSFSNLQDAKYVILIEEIITISELQVLLNSIIVKQLNKQTAVLVNFDITEKHLINYGIISNNVVEKKSFILWAKNAIENSPAAFVIYLKNPLIPLTDFKSIIAVIENAKENCVVVAKITNNKQQIISAGHELDVYGRLTTPFQLQDEFSNLVMHDRNTNAISNEFFATSKSTFLQLISKYDASQDFSLQITLAALKLQFPVRYKSSICFLKENNKNFSSTPSSWESALSAHKMHTEIQSFLKKQEPPRNPNKRIIFVDSDIPKPDQDAASVTHMWYLQIMHSLGFEITYISAFSGDLIEKYCFPLYEMGIKVIGSGSPEELQFHIAKELGPQDVLFVSRAIIASHLFPVVRNRHPEVKIIFNTVDLDFLRKDRLAHEKKSAELLEESRIAKTDEINLLSLADETLVVSSFEKILLNSENPSASVHHVRLPYVVEGYDPVFSETDSLIFVGGFNHRPNVDSILHFLKNIWPIILESDDQIALRIVGSNVTAEILATAKVSKNVQVYGYVENIEPLIQKSRISIAPLIYGAGTKGKVIQALSLGIPVVASQIAAEGIGLESEKNVLISESPTDFAARVLEVYYDQKLWESLQKEGKSFVEREHSPILLLELFSKILF